jgi:MarR family transcriptional regulator, lower aerobic nicotinate degradation pathway regulator
VPDRPDLLGSLYPITKALRQIEDESAAERGITMWQYAILAVADHQPGLNQGDVARLLDYSKNRIVADIDHLEEAGLLRRTSGSDRRANLLGITRAGRSVLRGVRAEIHRREDLLLAGLSPTARAEFDRIVHRLGAQVRAARSGS